MAIILDETTLAAYQAQTVASTRASLIVSALSGTVVVEVCDGNGVVRASGTMNSPWATASGATITVGKLNGAGIPVTSGGVPDSNWYCQFRSGSRFVRGGFGVYGSGADFVWSLPSFAAGQKGTIGAVVLTAVGTSNLAPINVTPPIMDGATAARFGLPLLGHAGAWANSPTAYSYQWQRSANGASGWADVSGGVNIQYTPTPADQLFYLRLRERATNASGSTDAYTAVTSIVPAIFAPTIATAPTLAGTPQVGNLLTLTLGAWNNLPTGYSYAWETNTVASGSGAAINGQTMASLVPSVGMQGLYIRGGIVASNSSGSSSIAWSSWVGPIAAAGAALPMGVQDLSEIAALPMIASMSQFSYIGNFRMPTSPKTSTLGVDYSYYDGGYAMGVDSSAQTLFVSGFSNAATVSEVAIPTTITSQTVYENIPQAALVQDFSDMLEGNVSAVDPGAGNGYRVGGFYVNGSSLVVAAYAYYDAMGASVASHFIRPKNLSVTGSLQGPYNLIPGVYPYWLSGYMGSIPAQWQYHLGGSAFTGLAGGVPNRGFTRGPALAAFNPNSPASSGKLLLGYPGEPNESTSLPARYSSEVLATNPVWTGASSVRGVVMAPGFRSVLFFGRHPAQQFCYGSGDACNDPWSYYQGVHGYPFNWTVWSYDLLDLIAVSRGLKQAHEVLPISQWAFSLPWEDKHGGKIPGGIVFDPTTNKLYVTHVQAWVGESGISAQPLVHVYRLNT